MSVLNEALFYAKLGWPVVPIIPGQKRPAIDRWVERATTDPELIEQWWTAHPEHGIGIVTGERAGIWVLDVDPEHGGDDTLADLEAEHGPLPDTVETITGSGGRHIFFKWPGWNPGTNAGILGPGLDIRAEGGQIVAPPTIHPNGTAYCFDVEHDPHDGIAVAEAPEWLLKILQYQWTRAHPRNDIIPYSGAPRPGDRFAATVSWPDLLEADGARHVDTRTDRATGLRYELWARPGVTDHASASLYYGGTDLLKVFTTNWPGLTAGETYTRFGYLVFTRYGGNFETATRELGKIQQDEQISRWLKGITPRVVAEPAADDVEPEDDDPQQHWPTFWNRDQISHEWLCEPFLPAGRGVAFYAPAKLGKSLLAFEVAVKLAAGDEVLARPAGNPVHVMYVDLEMTADDLEERLTAMGYGPDNTPDMLHYYLLPPFAPCDTKEGADDILKYARKHRVSLVVIDTMARAVEGEENSADTYRAFYRHLGRELKSDGIALLRIDHAGKDQSKGMRGSSEKAGDVDVIWKLEAKDAEHGLFTLKAPNTRRVTWVPDKFEIRRHQDPLRHEYLPPKKPVWPPGTKQLADLLDRYGVPLDATEPQAQAIHRACDSSKAGRNKQVMLAALAYRKNPEPVTEPSDSGASEPRPEPETSLTKLAGHKPGTVIGTVRNQNRVLGVGPTTQGVGTTQTRPDETPKIRPEDLI